MSVYYKYATDGSNLVVLSYVYYCVYWYTYEELVNWFVDTLGKVFNVNLLVYAHFLCPFVYHNLSTILLQLIKLYMLHQLLQGIYTLPQ